MSLVRHNLYVFLYIQKCITTQNGLVVLKKKYFALLEASQLFVFFQFETNQIWNYNLIQKLRL